MSKEELIRNLLNLIDINEEQQGEYEKKHGEFNAKWGDEHSIYSELADWSKGKAVAYRQAIELIEELA